MIWAIAQLNPEFWCPGWLLGAWSVIRNTRVMHFNLLIQKLKVSPNSIRSIGLPFWILKTIIEIGIWGSCELPQFPVILTDRASGWILAEYLNGAPRLSLAVIWAQPNHCDLFGPRLSTHGVQPSISVAVHGLNEYMRVYLPLKFLLKLEKYFRNLHFWT